MVHERLQHLTLLDCILQYEKFIPLQIPTSMAWFCLFRRNSLWLKRRKRQSQKRRANAVYIYTNMGMEIDN